MSISGVVAMLRGNPLHPVGDDGRMALSDHLRELRARLMKSALFLFVCFIVGLFFYDDASIGSELFGFSLLDLVLGPYQDAVASLGNEVDSTAYISGAGGPLLLQLKLAGVAAVVVSSPYWIFQIWAFIVPGLHPQERKWTRVFAAVAGPLFISGVAVGYYVLPKGLQVLIGFTPDALQNLVEFGEYFSFLTRMLLVFGIGFEIPLFVILLNLAGVVSGAALGRYRPWIIIGTAVFAAVATPSTDPFGMLMLAIPMLILFMVAEIIARLFDRLRGRGAHRPRQLADDELSPL